MARGDKKTTKQSGAGSGARMPKAAPADGKAAKTGKMGAMAWAGVAIVIVLFAVAGLVVFGALGGQTSFKTFQGNFNGARDVAIIVTAYNGSGFSAAVGCGTLIIEQVVGSQSLHRNSSTIGFYAINQTSCVYQQGLGSTSKNYSYDSPAGCISMTSGMPRIFINYSATNNTRITPTALYVSGNAQFLSMCGVASEITAT